jgi:hypothetical protein
MERPRKLVLPPHSPFPDLDAARDELARLEEERRRAGIAIDSRVADRVRAEELDLRDQADAIRTGSKDPGWKRRDKIDKEKEQWEDRFAAITQAIRAVEDEVLAMVEERRDEFIATAQEASAVARDAYRVALEEAARANTAVREANALLRWVSMFPDMKGTYKTPDGLTSMRSPSGDPYAAGTVIASLIEEASVTPTYERAPQTENRAETVEEARARVMAEQEMRYEMGFEERPRKTQSGPLPPNSVIGGRTLG